ncbi:hypothetical protein A2V49_00360 [candidate division WWE3 bacterium RBG_19FT_COMBO_34_6]|uniref:CBM-cenC domain-containing protein n=1 Tax=candidate division WWE3 bacterium RBG_19FT_COMBO_34_6 TaxID=1802612 RepID=A0A1F4UN64_UNCKA|nr:MAG: hypothetical protein A2V49_00360 [candidate division WWE3 bacterium RBG_19FT_COMBO_34_6]
MPRNIFLYSKIAAFLVISMLLSNIALAADVTSPTTTYTKNPANPNGNNGWYITPVNFELNAIDLESGVKEIHYKIDDNPWQIVSFSDSLNLVTNPSFEIPGSTSTSMQGWEVTINDGQASHSRDTGEYLTGYETSSARIIASAGPWHGINNKDLFAVAEPFGNMSASLWMKTSNVVGNAYFIIYIVSQDGLGNITYSQISQSDMLTGITGWTKLSTNFVVNDANAIGVYIDFGLNSSGTIWVDAASISESTTSTSTNVSIVTDGSNHTLEFFSVDNANNSEFSLCPATNCARVSIDQTPPGNWHDSGAYRSLGGAEHELFVFTNVDDPASGLSTNTNNYMYTVDDHPDFGHYANLLHCNTAWKSGESIQLEEYPLTPGLKTFLLTTQKTDFCNSNWKICKTVRFFAEDMAGNDNSKDFCINGPWIKIRGEGIVRSNQNIDMIAEPEEDNTDGLIELLGNMIDFFSSTTDWIVKPSPTPQDFTYSDYFNKVGSKTTLNDTLIASTGVYYKNGDFEISNQSLPNDYDENDFDQVVFINGNLRINSGITISENSTSLFVVSGNVEIAKAVEYVDLAIFSDQDIYTAYDINPDEATKTLYLKGLYSADKIYFQRTLQGTNNQKDPAVDITYEPKYLLQIRDIFGKNYVIWKLVK